MTEARGRGVVVAHYKSFSHEINLPFMNKMLSVCIVLCCIVLYSSCYAAVRGYVCLCVITEFMYFCWQQMLPVNV